MSYGPIRKGRTPTPVKKPYELDYDSMIDSIIHLTSEDEIRAKALTYKRESYDTFVHGGIPTKQYRKLLIRILERFETFTRIELHRISVWLFSWEEESLTGIIKIKPTDPIYEKYTLILRAIFGDPIPFQNQNGELDLANSTIVIAISEIEKPCPYGKDCRRVNPLHKQWRHPQTNVPQANVPQANAQGGKRRKTLRKRKQSKRTQSRTHKI